MQILHKCLGEFRPSEQSEQEVGGKACGLVVDLTVCPGQTNGYRV